MKLISNQVIDVDIESNDTKESVIVIDNVAKRIGLALNTGPIQYF
ncbi:hypothetical protein [Weissella sagaensis]|nr:hypothetical protein [Weissella sagaensis]